MQTILLFLSTVVVGGGLVLPASIFFNFMPKAKCWTNGISLAIIGVILLIAVDAGILWFAYMVNLNMNVVIIGLAIISGLLLLLPIPLSRISKNQHFMEKKGC